MSFCISKPTRASQLPQEKLESTRRISAMWTKRSTEQLHPCSKDIWDEFNALYKSQVLSRVVVLKVNSKTNCYFTNTTSGQNVPTLSLSSMNTSVTWDTSSRLQNFQTLIILVCDLQLPSSLLLAQLSVTAVWNRVMAVCCFGLGYS